MMTRADRGPDNLRGDAACHASYFDADLHQLLASLLDTLRSALLKAQFLHDLTVEPLESDYFRGPSAASAEGSKGKTEP